MKPQILLASIAAVLTLSCQVGPRYKRPAVKVPDQFRAATTADGPSLANMKWFEVFQDPQLGDLMKVALTGNFDLRLAAARIDAARATVGVVRANQIPQFNAGADLTTIRNSASGQFALQRGISQDRTFGNISGSLLSYELDFWGRLRSATAGARADLLGAEENRKAVITTLVGDVATSYFALLELDLELEIAKRTLSVRQESQRLINVRQKGGVATLLDVRQSEQLVYAATQVIPDIERQIEITENRLSLLTGRSPAAITRGRKLTEQRQPPAIPTGLPSSLLERRPDIRVAEQSLISANAQIGVAKAAYFPRIGLTGLSGFQSNQLTSLFTGPTGVWQFVPQLSQPIFTAGRLSSNVALSRANEQTALINYERAIQTAFREVSDALIQYQRVKEVHTQQDLLVETLKDRSRLAYLRYRGGVDTLLNALDADRDLFNAELNLARTQRDELLALVQLYKALGGGWD